MFVSGLLLTDGCIKTHTAQSRPTSHFLCHFCPLLPVGRILSYNYTMVSSECIHSKPDIYPSMCGSEHYVIQSSLLIMDLLYNGPLIIMDLFESPDFR